MRKRTLAVTVGIPLLAAFGLGYAISTSLLLTPSGKQTPPVFAPPVNPPAVTTVAGLGTIEPRGENILIGPPLPGIITRVYVQTGMMVKKGHPLFGLDARELTGELAVCRSALRLEEARLARLRACPRPEDLPPAKHRVAAARVEMERQQDLFNRIEGLFAQDVASPVEFKSRRFAALAAEAGYRQAWSELERIQAGAWREDVTVAEAEVELARVRVQKVERDLDRLTVRSPIDGKILKVNVHEGEFAGIDGFKEPLIILGENGPLHVRVQVDEEDAGRIFPAQEAEGLVRGREQLRLILKFIRIEPLIVPKRSFTGGTRERIDTRVLIVVYEITQPCGPIYVGQQVEVFLRAKKSGSTS